MTSPRARAWYVFSDALPDGELVMPIVTPHGTAIAVRPGHMTDELMAELNQSAEHLISIGIWQPGEGSGEPPREE
jgi:hypothetical protein